MAAYSTMEMAYMANASPENAVVSADAPTKSGGCKSAACEYLPPGSTNMPAMTVLYA